MYAAAGGASLASRQARRNVKKQHSAPDVVHQQMQKRFNLHQAQHAPASADHYQQRVHDQQLLGRLPENCRHFELKEPFPLRHDEHHLLRTAPVGLHSRLNSYADLNGRITGFGSSDLSEGKAATAWSERERRSSATEASKEHRTKQKEAHGRWMKRNRIHDSSFGGSSSEDEDLPGGLYHQSAAANALLYVGLGTMAIGLVVAFVGTGEKGFKTMELRLVGPTIFGSGVLCCLVRIFLCVCPTRCLRRRFRHRHRRKHQSPGAQLNRHGFQADKCTDYYRHLPYSRAAQDFALEQPKKTKKRVSIIPAGQSQAPPPRVVPPLATSPAPDSLLELNRMGAAAEDTHSLSSEDSFNENLLLQEKDKDAGSAERLARLKSTLTFQDAADVAEVSRAVTRIDEEEGEGEDSTPSSPMLAAESQELVLCPANLQSAD